MHEAGASWKGLQTFPGQAQGSSHQLIYPKAPATTTKGVKSSLRSLSRAPEDLIPNGSRELQRANPLLLLWDNDSSTLTAQSTTGFRNTPNLGSGVQTGPSRHLHLKILTPRAD